MGSLAYISKVSGVPVLSDSTVRNHLSLHFSVIDTFRGLSGADAPLAKQHLDCILQCNPSVRCSTFFAQFDFFAICSFACSIIALLDRTK